MKDAKASARKITDELIQLLGVNATTEVTEEGEGESKLIRIKIDAKEESGLLIGSHGMTLEAIQTFVAIALKNETGEWVRVFVDIADWSERQKEKLEDLAKQAAERAKSKGEPQYLYNLNSSQRRIVHMTLSEDSEIETVSEGEGEERYLVVKSK